MGYIEAADAASKSSGSALTFPILIVLVFVGFYFLMIRPQRRRQQAVQQQQRTITPGARVREVAAAVGYLSPNHFRSVFKACAKVSPSAWTSAQQLKTEKSGAFLRDPP